MNTADQCRKMKLKVGDTIFGREDTCGHWHEARLTLLWLGESVAVWSERTRSNAHGNGEWSDPKESADWTLSYRKWEKVETERQS